MTRGGDCRLRQSPLDLSSFCVWKGKIVKAALRHFSFVALSFAVFCSVMSAQTDSIVFHPDAERQFVEAMRAYQAGSYDTAAQLFQKNLREYPRSHRSTAAYAMGAKAFLAVHKERESIKLLKDLLDLYPNSAYCADAHYTLGLNYYELNRFDEAAGEWLVVRDDTTNDVRMLAHAETMLDQTARNNLSVPELQALLSSSKSDVTRALLSVRIAEKLNGDGNVAAAKKILTSVAFLPPHIKYVGEALFLLEQVQKRGSVDIGVVLPLMMKSDRSSSHELGEEFLEGIQYAVDEYNETALIKVHLDIRDTERDPTTAARQVADLCSKENISAIIGPILSPEALACVGIANERGVPIVTPTATANGMTLLGPNIFQANPDYETKGRIAALYAWQELKAKTFAVLAASDAIGKQLAEAFIREVRELGGDIVTVSWYTPGATDIRKEIESIRRSGTDRMEVPFVDFGGKLHQNDLNKIIAAGVSRHMLDSLNEHGLTASVVSLFGKNGKHIADSLRLPTEKEPSQFDSLRCPVTSIDAVFIPVAGSEEIPVVSSQLKYENIQTQILGTGDWNDLNELDSQRQYTDGVIFFVDSYTDVTSDGYRIFQVKYQRAMKGRVPSANVLIGYDVMKMMLETVRRGATQRREFSAELGKVSFDGWHSKILFSKNRVNSAMTVMQYKQREIRKIGTINLQN
jgi:ABC-type branched-subunit amino acid transport system substrate-binding protein/outer membrane protein assembly factor BamD (BamD/ComL family)